MGSSIPFILVLPVTVYDKKHFWNLFIHSTLVPPPQFNLVVNDSTTVIAAHDSLGIDLRIAVGWIDLFDFAKRICNFYSRQEGPCGYLFSLTPPDSNRRKFFPIESFSSVLVVVSPWLHTVKHITCFYVYCSCLFFSCRFSCWVKWFAFLLLIYNLYTCSHILVATLSPDVYIWNM